MRIQSFRCDSCGDSISSTALYQAWISCRSCGNQTLFDPVDHRSELNVNVHHTGAVVHYVIPAPSTTEPQETDCGGLVALVIMLVVLPALAFVIWQYLYIVLAVLAVLVVAILAAWAIAITAKAVIEDHKGSRSIKAERRAELKAERDPDKIKKLWVVAITVVVSVSGMLVFISAALSRFDG